MSLGRSVGSRLFGSLVGLMFVVGGSILSLSSLPHTEIFLAERLEGGFHCTRAQALAGRWTLFSKKVSVTPDARCEIVRHEDEGSTTFQARVVSASGTLAFGKSKANRAAVQAAVDEVNLFFATRSQVRAELRDDVWWWWLAPFGLVTMGIGTVVFVWMNGREIWDFDRGKGEATRCFSLLGRWRPSSWQLAECGGVAPVEMTDHEGATLHNLELSLASGEKLQLSSTSPPGPAPASLVEAARRINTFLWNGHLSKAREGGRGTPAPGR